MGRSAPCNRVFPAQACSAKRYAGSRGRDTGEAMTSKERMIRALERGKPDRLPVSVHQWQPYHLEEFLGGISELEAFEKFGMDAQVQYFADMGQFWVTKADYSKASAPQWRDEIQVISDNPDNRIVHHTIVTPKGNLTYKTAGDR